MIFQPFNISYILSYSKHKILIYVSKMLILEISLKKRDQNLKNIFYKIFKYKLKTFRIFSGLSRCFARDFMELTTEIIPVAKAKLGGYIIHRFI